MKRLAIIVPIALAACERKQQDSSLTAEPTHHVVASVYWEPQRLACEPGMFRPHGLTFAHKTLPCGTRARFGHGGRSVVARMNDRGPYVRGRDVDLSEGAANAIGLGRSVHHITMEIVQ